MGVKDGVGAVILRIILGVMFFIHGVVKFQGGIENTAGWFGSIGLPSFMAYAVASLEVIGGILLVAGLGTRIISSLFVLLMLGAIIKVKLAAGFLGNGKMAGYELELAYLTMSLFLVINGSSQFSIAHLFEKKESSQTQTHIL